MRKFKSIEVDETSLQKVSFCNPFDDDRYSQLYSRKEIVKAWKEECRIRDQELSELDSKRN